MIKLYQKALTTAMKVQELKYEGTAKITHFSNMADNIIQEDPFISIDKSYYQEMMGYYEIDYKKKDNVYYQITDMPYVNIKEVHFAKLIDMKDGTQTFLEVNASLQPVNEVVNVLRDYAIFFLFNSHIDIGIDCICVFKVNI